MKTGAPGLSSARLAGSKLTTAVRGVTSTCFSPPLYCTVSTLPSPMFLMSATLAFVILLSGRKSQSRWPSPVPRMFSGKMCTSSATSAPSRCPTVVVPMNLPLVISAMLALVMPMTTTLSGTLIFIVSPLRALTVSTLPSTFSSVPRIRVGALAGACASAAAQPPMSASVASVRIMWAPRVLVPIKQRNRARIPASRHRAMKALQLELADRLDLRKLARRRVYPLADQDLAARRLAAEPRGEVGHRADGAVVEAPLEADRADGRK